MADRLSLDALVSDKLAALESLADDMAMSISNGLKAESRIFDLGSKKMMTFPDHKTRLYAFEVAMEHMVGKPVERQVVKYIDGKERSPAESLDELKQSPALRAALRAQLEEAEEAAGDQPAPKVRAVERPEIIIPAGEF